MHASTTHPHIHIFIYLQPTCMYLYVNRRIIYASIRRPLMPCMLYIFNITTAQQRDTYNFFLLSIDASIDTNDWCMSMWREPSQSPVGSHLMGRRWSKVSGRNRRDLRYRFQAPRIKIKKKEEICSSLRRVAVSVVDGEPATTTKTNPGTTTWFKGYVRQLKHELSNSSHSKWMNAGSGKEYK